MEEIKINKRFVVADVGKPTPPCPLNCPDRRGGCAVACPKWQEYEKARNANYEERSRQKAINQTDTYAKQKRMEKQDKAYISLRKAGKKLNGSV